MSIEKESYVPGINCRNVTYLGLVEMIVHIESGKNIVRELFRSTQWSLVGNFFVGDRDKKDCHRVKKPIPQHFGSFEANKLQ